MIENKGLTVGRWKMPYARYLLTSIFYLLAALSAFSQAKTNVTFTFDYPAVELTTNIEFRIWTHTNIAIPFSTTNWSVVTNFPGLTNRFGLGIQPGVHFYLVTARFTQGLTNDATGEVTFLESDPSNAVLVHMPRRGQNLTLRP